MPSVGCFEKLGMCLGFLLLPLGAFYVWKYEGINEEYCTPGVYAAETLTVEASCLYNAGNNEKPVHLSCPVVTDDSSVVEPVTGATIQSLTYSSVLAVQTSAAAWGWHETHYDETMIADEDDNGEKFDCYCYFLEWSQNHKAIDSSHLDHICQLGALANTHRLACPDTADSPTKADIDKFNDLLEPELRLGTWTAYAEHAKLGTDDGDYQFSLTKEQIKETVGLVEVDAYFPGLLPHRIGWNGTSKDLKFNDYHKIYIDVPVFPGELNVPGNLLSTLGFDPVVGGTHETSMPFKLSRREYVTPSPPPSPPNAPPCTTDCDGKDDGCLNMCMGQGDCDKTVAGSCAAGLQCGENNCGAFRSTAGWPTQDVDTWHLGDDCCYDPAYPLSGKEGATLSDWNPLPPSSPPPSPSSPPPSNNSYFKAFEQRDSNGELLAVTSSVHSPNMGDQIITVWAFGASHISAIGKQLNSDTGSVGQLTAYVSDSSSDELSSAKKCPYELPATFEAADKTKATMYDSMQLGVSDAPPESNDDGHADLDGDAVEMVMFRIIVFLVLVAAIFLIIHPLSVEPDILSCTGTAFEGIVTCSLLWISLCAAATIWALFTALTWLYFTMDFGLLLLCISFGLALLTLAVWKWVKDGTCLDCGHCFSCFSCSFDFSCDSCNSTLGIFIGIVLLLAGVGLVFYNESNEVCTTGAFVAEPQTVESGCTYSKENAGLAVHLVCPVQESESSVTDLLTGASVSGVLALKTTIESYRWFETKYAATVDDTAYSCSCYQLGWTSEKATFAYQASSVCGHDDVPAGVGLPTSCDSTTVPTSSEIKHNAENSYPENLGTRESYALHASLGSIAGGLNQFKLTSAQIEQTATGLVKVAADFPAAASMYTNPNGNEWHQDGSSGEYYKSYLDGRDGSDALLSPQIGDVRMSLVPLSATTISVIATTILVHDESKSDTVSAASLTPFNAGGSTMMGSAKDCGSHDVASFTAGEVTMEAMYDALQGDDKPQVLALRVVAFVIFALGCYMIIHPLSVAPELCPCAGAWFANMVYCYVLLIALLGGLSLATLATAFAFLCFNLGYGLQLFGVAVVLMIVACFATNCAEKNSSPRAETKQYVNYHEKPTYHEQPTIQYQKPQQAAAPPPAREQTDEDAIEELRALAPGNSTEKLRGALVLAGHSVSFAAKMLNRVKQSKGTPDMV